MSWTQPDEGVGNCHSPTGHTPIVTKQFAPYGGRIQTCPTGVRFHIQQESDIPASTQLYNQICFAIAAAFTRRASLAKHAPVGDTDPDCTATLARCTAS